MKRNLNTLMTIVILVAAFAVSAQAQTGGTPRELANIPFAFNVGKTTLPAGKYTVTVVNPSSDRKVLQIRSNDGRSTAITQTVGVIGKASDKAKLVFHRYGDQYFFAQAQMAGETVSLAALKSSAERAQEHAIAKAGKRTVVVIIAE
jgi:hypothetical protein